jgi:hypothetical protein
MKPVDIKSSIGLDRLATWNEVRCAMSMSSQRSFAVGGACEDVLDMDSERSDRAGNPPRSPPCQHL